MHGFRLQALHADRGGLVAAQGEGGPSDTDRHGISTEPHARDDLATRAGDEPEPELAEVNEANEGKFHLLLAFGFFFEWWETIAGDVSLK